MASIEYREKLRRKRERYQMDAEYRERRLAKGREYDRKRRANPEFSRSRNQYLRDRIATDLPFRCRVSLNSSKHTAKKRGHTPCSTDIGTLVDAFTGYCHLCGAAESSLPKRLCLDHDHSTGEFRGWLCWDCNVGLGKLKDNVQAALTYLGRRNNVE